MIISCIFKSFGWSPMPFRLKTYWKKMAIFVSFISPQIMESAETYADAVEQFSGAHLPAPIYFILGGAHPGEGAVLTRERVYTKDIWLLDPFNGRWVQCSSVFLSFATSSSKPWWRHQTETFSALLALCAGNSPVTGEFPSQRPVTRNFDVFFDLCLNKRLSKQS